MFVPVYRNPKTEQNGAGKELKAASYSLESARKKQMANPENIEPYKFKPGKSGNPSGQPKEAATLRALTQRMWGLYFTDDGEYQELAAKYPRIDKQLRARAQQALGGNTAAINRVDTETLGPLKQSFTFRDLDKADDETIRRLAGLDLPN